MCRELETALDAAFWTQMETENVNNMTTNLLLSDRLGHYGHLLLDWNAEVLEKTGGDINLADFPLKEEQKKRYLYH